MNSINLYIVSDLHTEMSGTCGISTFPDADILILAGDIGNPTTNFETFKQTLVEAKKKYKEVIFIAGNHEYYGCNGSLELIQEKLKLLATETQTHFLQRESKVIMGIEFIGATLWSLIDKYSSEKINDFRQGVFENYLEYIAEFSDDYRFLRDSLRTPQKLNPRVVITHHLPSDELINQRFKHYGMNSAFSTNIISELDLSSVSLWACGHTHESAEIKKGGTIFVVNPIGYPKENRVTKVLNKVYTFPLVGK